jgi:hypothetical protein
MSIFHLTETTDKIVPMPLPNIRRVRPTPGAQLPFELSAGGDELGGPGPVTVGLYRDCPSQKRRTIHFDRAVSSGSLAFAADAVCYGNSIVVLLFDRFTTAWERYG